MVGSSAALEEALDELKSLLKRAKNEHARKIIGSGINSLQEELTLRVIKQCPREVIDEEIEVDKTTTV